MYYEYLDALKLELFAQAAALRKSGAGRLVRNAGARIAPLQDKTSGVVSRTKAGGKIGSAARETASFIADLPFLTIPTDVIRMTHCIDQHIASVKAEPGSARRLIQLAEAMRAVHEELTLLRVVRRADPSTLLTALATQFLVHLGEDDDLTTEDKLLRKAWVLLAKTENWQYGHYHVAARMYRLAGQHNRAQTFAARAAECAFAQRAALPPDKRGWFEKGLSKLVDPLVVRYTGDLSNLEPYTRWKKREGAAMTTLAWSLFESGDPKRAEQAARRALALGFSGGNEVLAALVGINGSVLGRFLKRYELLLESSMGDRRYYRGHWRGLVGVGNAVWNEQFNKLERRLT